MLGREGCNGFELCNRLGFVSNHWTQDSFGSLGLWPKHIVTSLHLKAHEIVD